MSDYRRLPVPTGTAQLDRYLNTRTLSPPDRVQLDRMRFDLLLAGPQRQPVSDDILERAHHALARAATTRRRSAELRESAVETRRTAAELRQGLQGRTEKTG
jgi:hypothetical protein